ncbi:hypothetical protein OJAG_04830 [Oerskovia enterophila]|uniref:Uncharacterized protein n=1 Tax=Oerskovia enterophila TaxID=43678 RepID=A0A163SWZ2_9CELL|nr:hypothetical protein OJAG_04830 [Oerskovia enterophila]
MLLLELGPPFGPAGVVLPLGAVVARVRAQGGPQARELLVVGRGGPYPRTAAARGGTGDVDERAERVAQRRRQVAAGRGHARVERLGDADLADRADARGGVGDRELLDLLVLGQDRGARAVEPAVLAGVEDHDVAGAAPRSQLDDVPDAQVLEVRDHLGATGPLRGLRQVRLAGRDRASEPGVLGEVAAVARHGLGVTLEGLGVGLGLLGQSHHAAVGLELGERRLQDVAGALAPDLRHEVDGHVVGGAEGGLERVQALGRQTREGHGVQPWMVDDDGVPLDVDAPAPGTPRELGVLPGGHVDVRGAVPLDELLEHDRAGGHVDAQGQGLGREHDLDQAAAEQVLDDLLEDGQHPGVVGRDAARERLAPGPVPQDVEVLGGQGRAALLDHGTDLRLLGGCGQAQARGQALGHRGLAPGPREDEEDRGQQPVGVQGVDDREPWRRPAPRPLPVPVAARPARTPAPATVSAVAASPATPRVPAVARPAAERREQVRVDGRVDPGVRRVHVPCVQVDQLGPRARAQRLSRGARPVARAHQDVLPQRDRSALADDHGGVAADHLEPVAELLGVGHGRGQRHELDVVGEVDDDLFPDGSAEPVGEVVDLVHDDEREPVEGARARVEHVAQDLGRHDDDRGVAVDRRVAGQEPDLVGAVAAREVGVLLVGQGLDGRGVEGLASPRQGQVDRELPHDGLARTRGCCHEHTAPLLEGLAGADLEVVEREADDLTEGGELGAGGCLERARCRVAFRGALGLVGPGGAGCCGHASTLRSAGDGAAPGPPLALERRRPSPEPGVPAWRLGQPGVMVWSRGSRTRSAPGTTVTRTGRREIRSPSANAGGGGPPASVASRTTERAW